MGTSASIQTNVTNITNKIRTEIEQQMSASANTNCNIEIGTIQFEKTNGCSITVSNKCYAEADGVLDIIQSSVVNFYNTLSNDQKQESASWFTATYGVATNVNNVVNDFTSTIKQVCKAEAELNENIKIQNIVVKECTAPEGQILKMEFINAGTATAQCAMKIFNNLTAVAASEIHNKQSQGLDWAKLLWPISIIVIVLSFIYLVIQFVIKKLPSAKDRLLIEQSKKDTYASRIKELLSYKEQSVLLDE